MNSIARTIAPILIVLFLGVAAARSFIATSPEPERRILKPRPPKVEVVSLSLADRIAMVEALGTVVPAREVKLQPEVAGVVRFVSESLKPGGLVKAGDILVRIDPRNYRLAVEERRAAVATRKFELKVEQGRQRVAQKEWDLLRESTQGEADEDLALRKPHLANAKAALAAAESALRRAQLDLQRTVLRAPFDAFVQAEAVEVGQFIGPNVIAATLIGTDAFWVQVLMPVENVAYIELPRDEKDGSVVSVFQSFGPGGKGVERTGHVVRLLGDLDPQGKMARVIVEIRDPLNRAQTEENSPVLLGSVVRVKINGRSMSGVYVVPRRALRGDTEVWVAENEKLLIRRVEVIWRGRNEVYVRGDLGENPRVITSRLSTPVDGMSIRESNTIGPSEVTDAR